MSRKTMVELHTELTALINDNTSGDITPADLRQIIGDFIDSMTPAYGRLATQTSVIMNFKSFFILLLFVALFIALITGCSATSTAQRSKQESDQSSAQSLGHSDASSRTSVPIIINCIQINQGETKGDRYPCWNREGKVDDISSVVKP